MLFPGKPMPDAILGTAQRFKPTLFFSVPTLYNAMLNREGAGDYDLSSIRLCVSAAEALPAGIWRRWKEMFGSVILDGIGSTEMLHIFISNTPEEIKPGSSGKPVPGYEAKILDEAGYPVEPGEAGYLRSRVIPPRRTTGATTRRPSRPCRASGSSPVIGTGWTRTASTGTRAARMT